MTRRSRWELGKRRGGFIYVSTQNNHVPMKVTHAGKGTRLYGGRQKGGKTHGKGEATAGTKHTVTGMVPCGRGNGIKRSQRGCVQTRKGNKLGRCNFQGGEKGALVH